MTLQDAETLSKDRSGEETEFCFCYCHDTTNSFGSFRCRSGSSVLGYDQCPEILYEAPFESFLKNTNLDFDHLFISISLRFTTLIY